MVVGTIEISDLVGIRRRLAKERRHVIDTTGGGELFSSLSHSSLAQTKAP